jgi:hypothetical protein
MWRDAAKLIDFKLRTRRCNAAASRRTARDFAGHGGACVSNTRGEMNVLQLTNDSMLGIDDATVGSKTPAADAAPSPTTATSRLTQPIATVTPSAGDQESCGIQDPAAVDTRTTLAMTSRVGREVCRSTARSKSQVACDVDAVSTAADQRHVDETKSVVDASAKMAVEQQRRIAHRWTAAGAFDGTPEAASGDRRPMAGGGRRWQVGVDRQNDNTDAWAATGDDAATTDEGSDVQILRSEGTDWYGPSHDGLPRTSVAGSGSCGSAEDRDAHRLPTSASWPLNEKPRENARGIAEFDDETSNANGRERGAAIMKSFHYIDSLHNANRRSSFVQSCDNEDCAASTNSGCGNKRQSIAIRNVEGQNIAASSATVDTGDDSHCAAFRPNCKGCRTTRDGIVLRSIPASAATSRSNGVIDRRVQKESCALAASRTSSLMSYSGDGDRYPAANEDYLTDCVSTTEKETGRSNVQRPPATMVDDLQARQPPVTEVDWSEEVSELQTRNLSAIGAQVNDCQYSRTRENTSEGQLEMSDHRVVAANCIEAEKRQATVVKRQPDSVGYVLQEHSTETGSCNASNDFSMALVDQVETTSHVSATDGDQTQKQIHERMSPGDGGHLSGDGSDNVDRSTRQADYTDKQCEETPTTVMECRLRGDKGEINSRMMPNDERDEGESCRVTVKGVSVDRSAITTSSSTVVARNESEAVGSYCYLPSMKGDAEQISSHSSGPDSTVKAATDEGYVYIPEVIASGVSAEIDGTLTISKFFEETGDKDEVKDGEDGQDAQDELHVKPLEHRSLSEEPSVVEFEVSSQQHQQIHLAEDGAKSSADASSVSDSVESENTRLRRTTVPLTATAGGDDKKEPKIVDDAASGVGQWPDFNVGSSEIDESVDAVCQLTCDDPLGSDLPLQFNDMATGFPSEDSAGSTMNLLSFVGANVESLQMIRPPMTVATPSGRRRYRNVRAAAASVGVVGGSLRGAALAAASHNVILVVNADRTSSPAVAMKTAEASMMRDGRFQRQ